MIRHSVILKGSNETIRPAEAETLSVATQPVMALQANVANKIAVSTPDTQTADLQESQELFRLAVESCPSGMVMIEGVGKIILVNSAIERMFGYPRGELIGQSIDVLVPLLPQPAGALHDDDDTFDARSPLPGVRRELVRRRKDAERVSD